MNDMKRIHSEGKTYLYKETETRKDETQTTEPTAIQPLVHSNYIIVKIKRKE